MVLYNIKIFFDGITWFLMCVLEWGAHTTPYVLNFTPANTNDDMARVFLL